MCMNSAKSKWRSLERNAGDSARNHEASIGTSSPSDVAGCPYLVWEYIEPQSPILRRYLSSDQFLSTTQPSKAIVRDEERADRWCCACRSVARHRQVVVPAVGIVETESHSPGATTQFFCGRLRWEFDERVAIITTGRSQRQSARRPALTPSEVAIILRTPNRITPWPC